MGKFDRHTTWRGQLFGCTHLVGSELHRYVLDCVVSQELNRQVVCDADRGSLWGLNVHGNMC